MIDAIVDSIIRGTLLGISLVVCGYGLWCFLSFMTKMAGRLFRWISDKAERLH